ncbi:tyrosine-type recombinase/integrase [Archangium violaceum]|uniref:tyrosine-type recombinase/integrase n=1 Tax=Archangium violaceum TaxID=83451 RepID=UPI0034E26550
MCGRGRVGVRAKVRPIRFHDLRHTTASLLMMSGANPAAVQRIMRHSDPRITTETYGHLSPSYLRAEVDRLSFMLPANLTGGQDTRPAGAVVVGPQGAAPVAASLLQAPIGASGTPVARGANPQDLQALALVQDLDAASTPSLSRGERGSWAPEDSGWIDSLVKVTGSSSAPRPRRRVRGDEVPPRVSGQAGDGGPRHRWRSPSPSALDDGYQRESCHG